MPDVIDHQFKRLDHLQGIVQRMAGNSFLLKGWAITLVTAILGFALKTPPATLPLAWLAVVPTLVFWGLDAYYLAVERAVRGLYNMRARDLAGANYSFPGPVLPSADIVPGKISFSAWLCAGFGRVTWLLYAALLLATSLVGTGQFTRTAAALVAI